MDFQPYGDKLDESGRGDFAGLGACNDRRCSMKQVLKGQMGEWILKGFDSGYAITVPRKK